MTINFDISDLIANMIELEKCGAQFYRRCADLVEDLYLRELFNNLSDQEIGHEKIYSRMLAENGASIEIDPDYKLYLQELIWENFSFRKVTELPLSGIPQALNFARRLEEESLKFLAAFDKLPGFNSRKLTETMRKEEQKHLNMIIKLLQNYTAPEA